jgi:tetratricopeptide (TPR) repeat protein
VKASLVLCVLLVAVARAQPAPDDETRAKAFYAEASRHYDLREYAVAIEGFRRAYTLLPDPLFLFDIAQSYRQLRDCDNARGFYKNYLINAPTADNRDKVEAFITEMDACVAEQQRAQQQHVDRPPIAAVPASHTALKITGSVTAGIGAVLVGGAVSYSLQAADKSRQLEQLCAGGCTATDTLALDRSGHDASRDAVVLYIVGGAAVAAGAVLFGWASIDEPVAITPLPGGAAVSTRVRF